MGTQVTPILERATIETILEASEAFALQSSTLRSSCKDQAQFLKNAAVDFQRWKAQWQIEERQNRRPSEEPDAGAKDLSNSIIQPSAELVQNEQQNIAGYNDDHVFGTEFYASSSWENFFTATGFDFDNWSLLPLSK